MNTKPTLETEPEPTNQTGYFAATATGSGFDDDGTLIATTTGNTFGTWHQTDTVRDDQAEIVLGLLRFIVGEHPDIERAGGRAHLLAFMAGASRFKTQRELGRKLKLSDSRMSQIRKEIQAILPSLEKCNRRQTKTHAIGDERTETRVFESAGRSG